MRNVLKIFLSTFSFKFISIKATVPLISYTVQWAKTLKVILSWMDSCFIKLNFSSLNKIILNAIILSHD